MKSREVKTFKCNLNNDDYYTVKVIGLYDDELETIITLEEDVAEDPHGETYWVLGGEFDEELEMYKTITLKKW